MHHESVESLLRAAEEGLTVVAIDNTPVACPWKRPSCPSGACCFRSRGPRRDASGPGRRGDDLLHRPFGSTRSINAGVAAGIAMHAWIRQYDLDNSW